MRCIKYKSSFLFGDIIDFNSPLYGIGQGSVDSIVLHHDYTVSFILDIRQGNKFGGPSPNLYEGFQTCHMRLARECEKKLDQVNSDTSIRSPFVFNDLVEFKSKLNGSGKGRIIEIIIDSYMNINYVIEDDDGQHYYGINANETKSVNGSDYSQHELIIEYLQQ
ncbi:MAG TPA: hypothetical protein VG122_24360 [Gemmata sp.]|jgi:hypothetical protein|nr:hypothetical protein [Gemmata sp.]